MTFRTATYVKMEGEQPNCPKKRIRLILDFKSQFPEKLYDVANDGHLVHWNRNGSVTLTCEDDFEQNVMQWYPGFLQIPSILNFKRLFREYGFDREIGPNGCLEWSHPLFVRGRRDLVKGIRTRRKSFRTPLMDPVGTQDSVVIPTDNHRRYSVRRRRKTQRFKPDESQGTIDIGGGGDQMLDNKNAYIIKPPHTVVIEEQVSMGQFAESQKNRPGFQEAPYNVLPGNVNQNANSFTKNFSPNKFMDTFAEKEFNEDEYRQWVAKKRKLDDDKAKAEKVVMSPTVNEKKSNEFWWMYENKTGGEIVQTVNLSTKQSSGPQGESCTPCGFCKCCSAISNYVHLFGEIPENIQVIDYLEEVVQSQESVPPVADPSVDNSTYLDVSEITVQETPTVGNIHTDIVDGIQLDVQQSAALDILESISTEDFEQIKTEMNLHEPADISNMNSFTSQAKIGKTGTSCAGNLVTLAMAVSEVENTGFGAPPTWQTSSLQEFNPHQRLDGSSNHYMTYEPYLS